MHNESAEVLLRAEGLCRAFHSSRGQKVEAVKSASLLVRKGETVGILGESGSGKSTLGQMIVGQQKPDGGVLIYRGEPLCHPYRGRPRREIQILFQHPEVSFNPRLTLESSLQEPYRFHHFPYSRDILLRDIQRFGLYAEHLARRPGELSGGELQRAALARILTVDPALIVLDEPTSMLDAISQAQVIQILRQVQEERQTGYVFITHNLALCKAFSHRIYRMHDGVLTEMGRIL